MITALTILGLCAGIIYGVTLLLFRLGLNHPTRPAAKELPFVSVVIAVKNEEHNLPNLLECLQAQTYLRERWELIIVDDNSTDQTRSILQAQIKNIPNLKIYSVVGNSALLRYKKAALAAGIYNAGGEIIVTTDADCRMGPRWLASMVSYFQEDVGIVVGFSGIQAQQDFFTRWQALDYLLLMAAAQGATNLGMAWACSGQNWAFRKILFERVGGYQRLRERVGGDDSLFMQLIRRKTRAKAVFASEPDAWVTTQPVDRIGNFLRQRIRWAAEANYMHRLNPLFFAIILATFLVNLLPLIFCCLWLGGLNLGGWALGMILFKFGVEFVLAKAAVQIYHRPELLSNFPFWFVVQMPYVVAMGIASFWGNRIGWKKPC